jgi:hypothetical protein
VDETIAAASRKDFVAVETFDAVDRQINRQHARRGTAADAALPIETATALAVVPFVDLSAELFRAWRTD